MKTKPVAALYARRRKNEPALTERRYRALYARRRPSCFACILFLLFFSPLFLSAAPKKDAAAPVEPTVVYDAAAKVLRGGTCEVTLRAISPQGYDVKFEILSEPRVGSLSGPQRNSKSSVSYFYTHDGKKNSTQDSFRFKCKSGPQKAWAYAKATILIKEPPARFAADLSALDFGSVFLGDKRTLPIRIKNAGGGTLQGRLKAPPPWKLSSPADLTLAEGEIQKILITFEPLSTDTQRGSLFFESGTKPFSEITLQGVGENRFEAPESAAFEQRVGANELRIPIKNLTAAPLPISVHFPPPLQGPESIKLPPTSTSELVLILPLRPFAEKSVLVTLGDGASMHDIRIQLPPSPSQLELAIEGKNQLGVVTPGRTVPLVAKLQNTGSASVTAHLRAEGDGFALAPAQSSHCSIPFGGNVTINITWTFPEKTGPAEATLTAGTEGLPPLQATWNALVQTPVLPQAPSPPSPLAPSGSPSPAPSKGFSVGEDAHLRRLRPSDPSYLLVPDLRLSAFFRHFRTATATLTWNYAGPEPVEFLVQCETYHRKGFFDTNPFDRRIPTTEDLPSTSLESVWKNLDPSITKTQKLPDGRWRAAVPSLSQGYHKLRIIAKQPGATQMEGIDLNIFVGDIPLPSPLSWLLPSLLVLSTTYLLRKKIRSLFR